MKISVAPIPTSGLDQGWPATPWEEAGDTLVEAVSKHAREGPDMELSREQVLAMAEPA